MLLTLTGCSKDVDIIDYIDLAKPVELVIREKADTNSLHNLKIIMLTTEDPRLSELIKWSTKNSNDWNPTPASYIMQDAYISQGDFHLSYYRTGGIVINYKDKEGKWNQVMKKIKPDEFEFIFK